VSRDPHVITNGAHRPVLDACTLTPSERAEFDYLDWDAIDAGNDSASFFRYRGTLYDLSEFVQSAPLGINGWDAFRADSFFSGVAIRYCQGDDGDSIVVALVLS
jgi:hypothetical protein